MKRKPLCWIVQRESDSRFLCRDGLWRRHVADYRSFKTFRLDVNAIKFGLKYDNGTAFAVYEGDEIDRDGRIIRANRIGEEYTARLQMNSR